jgi:hypothetical protein
MESKITLLGKIEFEPENLTKKHINQSSWKHIAMVLFDGDVTEYYAWFINKRYNLKLNKPIRGGHISFINDSFNDMTLNGQRTIDEVKTNWEQIKNKWNNEQVEISLSLSPRTDGNHWWLNIPFEDRSGLHGIRAELGLPKPFFGLHMTIGYPNERWLSHSEYIHELIKKGFIN